MSGQKKIQKAEPIDISAILGKARNKVYRVGIELEGGWRKLPAGTGGVDRDGSVRFNEEFPVGEIVYDPTTGMNRYTYPKGKPPAHIGELPSPALSMDQWEKWVQQHYPSDVNKTCGCHVHMSFRSALMYQRLMDPRYQATVIAELEKWARAKAFEEDHPIWDRLAGKSEYCQHKFFADEQASNARKDYDHFRQGCRYTFINYCFSRHGTIECRGLPMMKTSDLAIEAIQQLFNITSAFLTATYKGEPKVETQWQVGQISIKEEVVEHV